MHIFLSYRRDDAAGQAGRLRDALAARFGDGSVFHDVSTIRPGQNFVDAMTAAIDSSDVVLVVIGPRWATIADGDGSRLADPEDYVHFELRAALAANKAIIPVTVAGAALPAPSELPEDLRPLLARQASDLRDTHWGSDLETLLEALSPERAAAAGGPITRARVVAAVAVTLAAIVVAVGLWRPWASDAPAPVAVLPVCEPALATDAGWTAIDLAAEPTLARGTLTFSAQAAGYRELAPGRWLLEVLVRMTNGGSTEPDYQADWQYGGVVAGGLLYPLRCFSNIAGGDLVGPGLSGDALVGIEPTAEPRGQIEVALGEGGRFVVGAVP